MTLAAGTAIYQHNVFDDFDLYANRQFWILPDVFIAFTYLVIVC